jgi:hypothetical protein
MLLLPPPSRCDPGKKTKGPKEGKKNKNQKNLLRYFRINQTVSPTKLWRKKRLRIH